MGARLNDTTPMSLEVNPPPYCYILKLFQSHFGSHSAVASLHRDGNSATGKTLTAQDCSSVVDALSVSSADSQVSFLQLSEVAVNTLQKDITFPLSKYQGIDSIILITVHLIS